MVISRVEPKKKIIIEKSSHWAWAFFDETLYEKYLAYTLARRLIGRWKLKYLDNRLLSRRQISSAFSTLLHFYSVESLHFDEAVVIAMMSAACLI